jgi:hypothetical protein
MDTFAGDVPEPQDDADILVGVLIPTYAVTCKSGLTA